MRQVTKLAGLAVACASLGQAGSPATQTQTPVPPSIATPDRVQTRIGTLEFKDGAPSVETVEKAFDTLDFTHALNAYLNQTVWKRARASTLV